MKKAKPAKKRVSFTWRPSVDLYKAVEHLAKEKNMSISDFISQNLMVLMEFKTKKS